MNGSPPRTLPAWLAVFGPGAIIASLTIGAGELIFSSRAGALFQYDLLWFFLLVLIMKWGLVIQTARHMVLTGAHPFQRWMSLPGPRGWFPLIFLFFAVGCFPIWVGFHAATIGTLFNRLAGTDLALDGAAHFLWGLAALGGVLCFSFLGGYSVLEKVQLGVVLMLLVGVIISVLVLQPDWVALLMGFIPQGVSYPEWAAPHPELANRPIWVEAITYVGVLGGSGYDYLAYVSYVRAKGWGRAGKPVATHEELLELGPEHPDRRWIRAVYLDATLSFLAVLIFTVVFVAAGATVLAPREQMPAKANLLELQAQFVTPLHPWLRPVYFAGAFLAMFGTLYGTLEVAPAIYREFRLAFAPQEKQNPTKQRKVALTWCAAGGGLTLLGSLGYMAARGSPEPPGLVAILTPANLFTGVLACGMVSLLALWADRRFLPRALRPNGALRLLNLIAGVLFLVLGVKAYWDKYQLIAFVVLGLTFAAGWLAATRTSPATQGGRVS